MGCGGVRLRRRKIVGVFLFNLLCGMHARVVNCARVEDSSMMHAVFRAALLFAWVVACQAGTIRTCLTCTLINEDFTLRFCSACQSPLSPFADTQTSSSPAPALAAADSPAGPEHIKCGWPLDDGTPCSYSGRSHHVQRHQKEFTQHSKHRAKLAKQHTTDVHGGVYNFFHKRPRPSDGSPPITSGTRFPDAAASSATSSTRTAPPSASPPPQCASSAASRERQVFQEYSFRSPHQSSEQEEQCDTGAGIHGVRLVYAAFPAQGYTEETLSRAAFENVWWPCLPTPRSPARLWDAEENAWWLWRNASLPASEEPMNVEEEVVSEAHAAADASLASLVQFSTDCCTAQSRI